MFIFGWFQPAETTKAAGRLLFLGCDWARKRTQAWNILGVGRWNWWICFSACLQKEISTPKREERYQEDLWSVVPK